MSTAGDLQRYRKNLRDEIDGAALYEALAEAETDPVRRDLYQQLSQAETEHAAVWRNKLAAAGIEDFPRHRSVKGRILAWLIRRFGVEFVLPTVVAQEMIDRNKYAHQDDASTLSSEERSHAAAVQAATQGKRPTSDIGKDIANAEPWHHSRRGNELRAAVLGANDGLVSNFSLVMGVAGAAVGNKLILLAGLSGLIAGASSMALGEWLSVTNARELARSQIGKEKEELELTPESEQKELALIFQAKGLPRAEAQKVAADLMRDKQAALDTLTHEELGIDPSELGGNPWRAAGFSFALFSVGAIFPVLPFLFTHGGLAIGLSVTLSAFALAVIGVATSLFNGRTAWYSAARQVVIGGMAAGLTYGIGTWLGVSLS